MSVLLTGGAGFLGSYVAKLLASEGFHLIILDDLSTGSYSSISKLVESGKAEFYRGDVRDAELMRQLARRAEYVVHLAARVSVEHSWMRPGEVNDVNAGGTATVLEASLQAEVEKLVYASSAAVYGEPAELPLKESTPTAPISPYGVSKLAGELYTKAYAKRGLKAVSLRYFNIYGLGQPDTEYSGVIAKFTSRVARGLPPVVYGDGEQTRDFIHASDAAQAALLALTKKTPSPVYNIATGKPTRIIDLAHLCIKLAKLDLKPLHTSPKPGDIRHSYADVTKARVELGFQAKVKLEEGLAEIVLGQKLRHS
ncbi:MAG: hypothetical protein DRN96_03665 [Thermoproteota archaeon]|nr:MAG: hypothetical protein DRN96_03665 [Candidatus Korarchaeota archaeon]RLG55278.1 MAG: hypothetical protein DRN99_03120 [Candidatus Korarchaeota archaeon]